MEGKSFSTNSHSFPKSKLDGELYYYCGSPSPRKIFWIQLNPKIRFHGCGRYREGSKCKFFKWADAIFSMMEVILKLLEKRHQPPSTLMDEVEDVDSMQAQMKGLTTLIDHLKREVSRLKIERNFYQALIVLLFSSVVHSNVK
ncbi:LOW QUALITY PROTEIN: hypothetical protein BT93_C1842 [Corymbia citriodora subsp. variegata]|nr:LOW QUALITY PROTEIN: hypothetical protein BT93_C1842 [Corymbia citriodora subsp. variegata]